jgi:hypothetical protein
MARWTITFVFPEPLGMQDLRQVHGARSSQPTVSDATSRASGAGFALGLRSARGDAGAVHVRFRASVLALPRRRAQRLRPGAGAARGRGHPGAVPVRAGAWRQPLRRPGGGVGRPGGRSRSR